MWGGDVIVYGAIFLYVHNSHIVSTHKPAIPRLGITKRHLYHPPILLGKVCTLFCIHCTENSKQIFPEMKLRSLFPSFCIHVLLTDTVHEC
jgi:hypothetical protein